MKKNKENRDNTPSKSDKKDALVIADMVKNGYYSFIRNTPEAFEELRVYLSNRDSVVTRLVSAKKTEYGCFVSTVNCATNDKLAYKQMMNNKNRYGKESGTQWFG